MHSFRVPGLHPRSTMLNRYADRTLGTHDMRAVGQHLIGCTACRARVDRIRQLGDLARAEPAPVPTSAMLGRIIARREGGERVILPVADVEPARRFPAWRMLGAAAVVLAIGGAAVFSSRTATAASDDGTLTFAPALPHAGAEVEAVYRPSARFTGDSVLVLRARFVAAARDVPPDFEPAPAIQRMAMTRRGDGTFHVRFTLPPVAVYAVLAVEDTGAQRLDTHGGRLWELLTSDEAGDPGYQALLAASGGRVGWDARHEAARALVAHFPDSLDAWRTLTFLNAVARGESDTASIAASRRALARFDSAARRDGTTDVGTISSLYWMAQGLRDSARATYWKAYVHRVAPRSRLGAQLHAVAAVETIPRDAHSIVRALPALEQLWRDVGAIDPTFTTFGLQGAAAAKDPVAIARWGRRYRDMTHDARSSRQWVGGELVKYASSRQEGLALLRSLLAPVDVVTDPRRRLRQAANERQRELDEEHAVALQGIGEGLLADHQHDAALDTLRLSARTGWNVDRFRDIAAAALSAGDTADAARMFALVAADPGVAVSFVDSARTRLGANVSSAEWQRALSESRVELRKRILATSVHTPLRGERVHLRSASGATETFAQLSAGHVTVVAFGADLNYKASVVNLAEMQSLAADIGAQHARVVVIALHPWSAGMLDSLRVRHTPIDVRFDDAHEADRAFSAYGFPIYYVVDASGTIRFAYSRVRDLRAQVATLTTEPQVARR